jgi:Domain of unknown function (DUF4382)/Domain of unknown function (DUF5666)
MRLKFGFTPRGLSAVKAGTTSLGVQVRWGKVIAGLMIVAVAALMTIACGGSSSSNLQQTASSNGALYTFFTDTPSCDVLSFGIFVTEMNLHKVGEPSTSLVTVWPTNSSPTSPVVEMSTLRDTMTVANLTSIPPGSYDQITMKVVVNSSSVYDSSQSPPVNHFSPTVTSTSVTIPLQPELTITSGKVSAVLIDLNLPQTLNVDSQGQLTGTANWVFSSNPVTASGPTGFGEMDSLYGFVRTVNTSSPGVGFTGSFLLQTLSATSGGQGPALSVDLTDSSDLCVAGSCGTPVSQISQLTTGSYVEVDAYVNENGNLVANRIQVEDREDLSKQLLGYLGPVLDVSKDADGSITQFDMLVRETEPTDPTEIPNSTAVTVYVSQSTTFNPLLLSPDLVSLASSGNLSFDPTTITPGQEVIVHGVFSKASGGPTTVAANSVYPRYQAVQGTFSSLVGTPGTDNKTGAFQMAPCNGLLSSNPFLVVTDGQTTFENTSGLGTLSPTTPMLVRGLSFFNLKNTTISGTGTPVPAGTMVLLAKQVRQF